MADWNKLNENDFENLLKNSLNDIPPQNIIDEVSPYKDAIGHIVWGIGLTTITLNFLLLNYILPFIGVILMLLGFRSLRKENKWFFGGYILSIIRLIYVLSSLILNSTIYNEFIQQSDFADFLGIFNTFVNLMIFICFWRALKAIKKKSNIDINTGFGLLFLYIILCVLAFLNYNGLILGIIFLIIYFLTLKSLYNISSKIENAGYIIKTAEVKYSNEFVVKGILIFLAICIIIGYVFFHSYNMNWTEYKSENQKSSIIDLGFPEYPEYILKDMSEEDIKELEGAKQVVVNVREHPINKGRVEETKYYEDGKTITHQQTVYDVKELKVTSIGVELENEWKIIHYFEWTHKPKFYGTESIEILPAYYHFEYWALSSDIAGYVFYDKDNTVYRADYSSIDEEKYKKDTMWGVSMNANIFARFSMPNDGENHRGYITYNIMSLNPDTICIVNSCFNYTHQKSWLQYPVKTATENRKTSGFGDEWTFKTIQDALQFYPEKDGAELV